MPRYGTGTEYGRNGKNGTCDVLLFNLDATPDVTGRIKSLDELGDHLRSITVGKWVELGDGPGSEFLNEARVMVARLALGARQRLDDVINTSLLPPA